VAELVSQLSGSSFSSGPIGQQLSEAKTSGDAQTFAPLLISTVQLLQARVNDTTSGGAGGGGNSTTVNETARAIAQQENTQVRTLLLQSVQTMSANTFTTVESMVQQAQWITAIASNPRELNQDFRQVACWPHPYHSV